MRPDEPWTWLGIGLSLVGLVLILVSIAYPFIPSPWNAMLAHLGSTLVGAGIVELISYSYMSKRLITHATNEIKRAMGLGVDLFYESRDDLPPLSEELKDVSDLWAAWHVGTVAFTHWDELRKRLRRVILTHPDSGSLKFLEGSVTRAPPACRKTSET